MYSLETSVVDVATGDGWVRLTVPGFGDGDRLEELWVRAGSIEAIEPDPHGFILHTAHGRIVALVATGRVGGFRDLITGHDGGGGGAERACIP